MDIAAVILPAVFSLVGVTLGAAGSMVGQYLGARVTRQQASAARVTALRAERKEAVLAFIEWAQKIEQASESPTNSEDAAALTHRMWYLQKCIEIVGGPELRAGTYEYAVRLSDAMHGRVPADIEVWKFIDEQRESFLSAARAELDIPDALLGTEKARRMRVR